MSNILKGYWVSVGDDARMVDSNNLVELKVKEEEERRARLVAEQEPLDTEDDFTEGLPFENIDALVDEDAQTAVIKSNANNELEEAMNQLQAARDELESIKAEAAQILEEAENEAQNIKSQAFEDGKAQGYNEGYESGMAEVDSIKADLAQEKTALEEEYASMVEELEPNFVDTLTDIYEHIFKVDLDAYRNIVFHLVTEAINGSDANKNIIVHVSKDDYSDILERKEDILSETGILEDNIEFIQDASLAQGGGIIETVNGVYDCSLATELRELKRKLMILAYRKD